MVEPPNGARASLLAADGILDLRLPMTEEQKSRELTERYDDATDNRTLDQIEEEDNVPTNGSDSPSPSPDEGSGRSDDDDAGEPM